VTRVLGVDYGSRRVGLALSDELHLTASPYQVIARGDLRSKLRDIADAYDIELVVVGLPTGLGGNETESASQARALAEEIASATGWEVAFVDERFTSRMAEGALLESGMRRRQRKETVDKVAAAIILQTYLDRQGLDGNS